MGGIMTLLTIQEFADKHDVSPKTVEYHLRCGSLKCQNKFGKRLIPSNSKFKKTNRGRKK